MKRALAFALLMAGSLRLSIVILSLTKSSHRLSQIQQLTICLLVPAAVIGRDHFVLSDAYEAATDVIVEKMRISGSQHSDERRPDAPQDFQLAPDTIQRPLRVAPSSKHLSTLQPQPVRRAPFSSKNLDPVTKPSNALPLPV